VDHRLAPRHGRFRWHIERLGAGKVEPGVLDQQAAPVSATAASISLPDVC
jgi:hypothetical protein